MLYRFSHHKFVVVGMLGSTLIRKDVLISLLNLLVFAALAFLLPFVLLFQFLSLTLDPSFLDFFLHFALLIFFLFSTFGFLHLLLQCALQIAFFLSLSILEGGLVGTDIER